MEKRTPVLLIDRDVAETSELTAFLASSNFEIDIADSVAGAVELFRAKQHLIVLVDYSITTEPNAGVIERIRAASGLRWTPMIFLVHPDQMEAAAVAMEYDGVDMLTKPVPLSLLKAKLVHVAKLIERNRTSGSNEGDYKAILDSSLEAVVVADSVGTIVEFNARAEDIFGWNAADVRGWAIGDFMPHEMVAVHEAVFRGEKIAPLWNSRRIKFTDKHDKLLVMEVRLGTIEQPTRILFTASMRDVSEQERQSEEISRMAHYDPLTGLPNRNLFQDRLQQLISISNRYSKLCGLAFIDLDGFKQINDTHGHDIGNRLLVEIANRLKGSIRESDIVARLIGDEFAVLLYDLRCSDDARIVADRLLSACRSSVQIGGRSHEVSASIGIAIFPDSARDGEVLVRQADEAMYHAKRAGKNQYAFYSAEINRVAQQKQAIERGLERALKTSQLVLHYQPQLDLRTQEIVGAEALVRWMCDGKLVPPNVFIPVAEESGLISAISEFVLRSACCEAKHWLDLGLGPRGKGVCVGVNISVKQFNLTLPSMVFKVLQETGLPARLLNLEITESFLVQDIDQAVSILTQLTSNGIQVSVDDFGTGYSCLAYLKRLPVSTIKVDRSFVTDIVEHPNNRAIVSSIVSLAKNLGLQTLAEGVEERTQVDALIEIGCDSCQGFYFSRPIDSESFGMLLAKSNRIGAEG